MKYFPHFLVIGRTDQIALGQKIHSSCFLSHELVENTSLYEILWRKMYSIFLTQAIYKHRWGYGDCQDRKICCQNKLILF